MRLFLLKISLLIVSCCFLISATETDIGSYHQTFFDDYDTYIQVEQQELPQECFFEKRKTQDKSYSASIFGNPAHLYAAASAGWQNTALKFPTPFSNSVKIFLLQSVWRI